MAANHYKHGKSHTRIYRIWANMKTRCYNPKATRFYQWGGKGVTVCDEWRNNFLSFYKWATSHGYADNLTLDRIDSNKGYGPDNCRWVDAHTQNINKPGVPVYEYNGIKFHQCDVPRLFGIKRTTFQMRLKYGWTLEEAINGR